MALKDQINTELKEAMKAKDELKLSVLRMLKSAIKYKEVEPGAKELDDAGITTVIGTLIKQRRDSVEQFNAANRADMAEKELKEIAVLQSYLPQQLTPDELKAIVAEAITAANAKSPKDMGPVMKLVTPKTQGRAEGKLVSEEVKAQLAKLS